MDYTYNGNLCEDERILNVVVDIVKKYPYISFKKASEAAMLEGKIDEYVNEDFKLNRLYNIMLVNKDKKEKIIKIYEDYKQIIEENNIKNKYSYLIENLNDYFYNNCEFPIIG